MTNLFQTNDGANYQAIAVRAYLTNYSGIEESWDSERKDYAANPQVFRWHNCREQGYVITMRSKDFYRQINIAFFEHRNSDQICALRWEQLTISGNPPTIETADFGGKIYKDKYDVSHTVGYGEASAMAEWIFNTLTEFWKAAP